MCCNLTTLNASSSSYCYRPTLGILLLNAASDYKHERRWWAKTLFSAYKVKSNAAFIIIRQINIDLTQTSVNWVHSRVSFIKHILAGKFPQENTPWSTSDNLALHTERRHWTIWLYHSTHAYNCRYQGLKADECTYTQAHIIPTNSLVYLLVM